MVLYVSRSASAGDVQLAPVELTGVEVDVRAVESDALVTLTQKYRNDVCAGTAAYYFPLQTGIALHGLEVAINLPDGSTRTMRAAIEAIDDARGASDAAVFRVPIGFFRLF